MSRIVSVVCGISFAVGGGAILLVFGYIRGWNERLPAFRSRRTSETANSAAFIIPHSNGVSNTLADLGAFSEGTRSPKKAANRSIWLL